MAGTNDNTAKAVEATSGLAPAPYRSQTSFVAAIRRGDTEALRLFFCFYSPLLRDQARQMGVPMAERDEVVTTLLDDIVLHLQRTNAPPRELARYLVAALRNRLRNRHRDTQRHERTDERAYVEHGVARERIVAECHSQYGLRIAEGPGSESAAPLNSAIEKLAARSALALTDVERELMIGLSRHVPLRELAAQAGLSYGAARVRVHRLRERFVKLAIQHVASLKDEERRQMVQFFRRAGISLDEPPSTNRPGRHSRRDDDVRGRDGGDQPEEGDDAH